MKSDDTKVSWVAPMLVYLGKLDDVAGGIGVNVQGQPSRS